MQCSQVRKFQQKPKKSKKIHLQLFVTMSTASGTSSTLLEALKEFRMDEETADIVLVCNGGEIKTHRSILSCRSNYFKKMLRTNFAESQTNRVELPKISQDVMNTILDYIYFESKEKINKEHLDHVLQIHQSSHLFQLDELANHCWELIMKSLDIDSVIEVWNAVLLYGNEEEIFVILQFILNNLEKIMQNDKFIALAIPQFKRLMEEIEKKSVAVTDSILAGIIKWCKNNPEEKYDLQNFLLHMNYDFLSTDFMKELTEKESSIFTEIFYKQMFLSRVVLPVKRDPVHTNINATVLSIKHKLSLKFFQFEGYVQRLNDYLLNESTSLKIIDLFNEANDKTVSCLPFLIGDGVFIPIQVDCKLYIFGGVPASSPQSNPNTSFILYDWQKNTIDVKPSLPVGIDKCVHFAVVSDNIYAFTVEVMGYLKLFSYSPNQKNWKTIPFRMHRFVRTVIGCVVLKETLYFIFTSEINNHQLYKLKNDEPEFVCNIPIPSYDREFEEAPYQGAKYTNKYFVMKKIIVHNNKLYVFMFSTKHNSNLYVVWDPENFQWKLNKFNCDYSKEDELECFSIPGKCICFYSYSKNEICLLQEGVDSKTEKLTNVIRHLLRDNKLINLGFRKVQSLLFFNKTDE